MTAEPAPPETHRPTQPGSPSDDGALGNRSSRTVPWPTLPEISILTILLSLRYGRIVNSYFLADDFSYLHGVLDGLGKPDWSVLVQHLHSSQHIEVLRPMVTLLHTAGYAIWGSSPIGYHLEVLTLHLLNSLLIYILVANLSPVPTRLFCLFSAALFVTHPIHPESVTYVSGIAGVACTAFYLAALIGYLRYHDRGHRRWLFSSLGCFVLALSAKEEALSLPFCVALITIYRSTWPPRLGVLARRLRVLLLYFSLLAAYFAYRLYIFGHLTPFFYREVHATMGGLLRGLINFTARLFSPVNIKHLGPMGWIIYTLILIFYAFGILRVKGRARLRLAVYLLLAYFILLIPVNHTLMFGIDEGLTNSHFLYLPSIPFVIGIAAIVFAGTELREAGPLRLVPLLLFLSLNLSLLNINNGAWAKASALMRFLQQESLRCCYSVNRSG